MPLVIVLIAVLIVAAVAAASGAFDRTRRVRRVAAPITRDVHEVIGQPVIERTVTERRIVEDDGVL